MVIDVRNLYVFNMELVNGVINVFLCWVEGLKFLLMYVIVGKDVFV